MVDMKFDVWIRDCHPDWYQQFLNSDVEERARMLREAIVEFPRDVSFSEPIVNTTEGV